MQTMSMFDDIEPAKKQRADEPTTRRSTKKTNPNKLLWSKYRPKNRVACDDCLQDLIAAGRGPVARDARYKRAQHGRDLLLCHAHAQLHRDRDSLPSLDDTSSRLR